MRDPQYFSLDLVKLYNGVKDISYKELSKDLMRQLEKELATAEEYQEFVQCRFRGRSEPS